MTRGFRWSGEFLQQLVDGIINFLQKRITAFFRSMQSLLQPLGELIERLVGLLFGFIELVCFRRRRCRHLEQPAR